MLPIETKNSMFGLYLYPEAKELMEKQQDINWFAQEIQVDKDTQDYLHNMTKPQYHATSTTLQTFVEIEQEVGEVWNVIASWFPHSEIEGMCSVFSNMEKSVHAFFYQKMSDVLNIDPETTAKNQQEIKALKDKLDFLKEITSNLDRDKPLTLITVAGIEQVLLFSNFALLKSFKSNGHNMIANTLTGVEYVINDEHLHGVGASYLHNVYISELGSSFDFKQHEKNAKAVIIDIVNHEDRMIDYIFGDEQEINDITPKQVKLFIRSRANQVLIDAGMEVCFEVNENPIADWFYKGANSIKIHDFFVAGTNSYRRGWSQDKFSRLKFLGENNE